MKIVRKPLFPVFCVISGEKMRRPRNVDLETGHVETVVLLSKLKTEKHIEVELDMDELDLAAVESKATYEEIKD